MLDNAAFVDDPGLGALRELYSFHGPQNTEYVSEPMLGKRKRSHGWREGVREALDNFLKSKSNFWNDLTSVDDRQWLAAVLNTIDARITECEYTFLNSPQTCLFLLVGHARTWASRVGAHLRTLY